MKSNTPGCLETRLHGYLGLFDDPISGSSALDRLANTSYQIVI